VQSADINKVTYTQDYQSAMSLLVIDFTFLEGRDGEILVKEFSAIDSHSNRTSSYLKVRTVWRRCHRLTPKSIRLLIMGAIGMMATYYIQS